MSNTFKTKKHRQWNRALTMTQLHPKDNGGWSCWDFDAAEALYKSWTGEDPPWKNEYNFYSRAPSWHTNLFCHRPARRKEKSLCRKVKYLEDYEDSPEFPLARKPFVYYW